MCQKAPQHDHPTVSAIKGVTVAACIGRLLLVSRHVRRRTFTHSNFFYCQLSLKSLDHVKNYLEIQSTL